MPIVTPAAPKQSIEALGDMLSTLAVSSGLKRAAPDFAARISASPRELRAPGLSYRVYVLELVDIVDDAGLTHAKLSTWRHEFTSENQVVAVDVTAGRRPRFSALNVGPSDLAVQRELGSDAIDTSDIGRHSYEVALLQVSALTVRALWLKSRARSHEDIVIPIAPMRAELTTHRRYASREFIDALRPAARRILADDDPGKGA